MEDLKQLILETCKYLPGSLERQRNLTKLIILINKSQKLWRENSQYYQDALQQTWIFFCQNLCEATTGQKYDPNRSTVTNGLNRYLKWRLQDFRLANQVDKKTKVTKIFGYLECIPCKHPQSSYTVPPEVWSNRIGYIVVQIDDSLREGTILGFASRVQNGVISQLESWDNLLIHLDRFKSRVTVKETLVNLSEWLEGIVIAGWETARELLSASENNLAFSFRSTETEIDNSLRRGKRLDLGDLGRVILLVELQDTESTEKIITVQVYPINRDYLPEQIQLQLLDDSDTVFATAISTDSDNYLQLQIHGASGERFKVEIVGGNNILREEFII